MQSCWRRAVALGRVVPARRAIAASSAREGEYLVNIDLGRGTAQKRVTGGREGEKARNGRVWIVVSVKSLEKLNLDVFLVVHHDYDLKNRCSPGRF